MGWEDLRQTYMSVLSDEAFRPEIDSDGDIHFKYEGGHYFVTRNCDDGFFYVLYPAFWPIDDVEELGRAVMAASNVVSGESVMVVVLLVCMAGQESNPGRDQDRARAFRAEPGPPASVRALPSIASWFARNPGPPARRGS